MCFQFVTHSVSQSRLLFGLYLRDIDFQRTFYKNKENLSCSLKIFNCYSFCVKCHFLIIFLYARFSVRKLLAWFSTYISVCLIWSLLRSYGQFVFAILLIDFKLNGMNQHELNCMYASSDIYLGIAWKAGTMTYRANYVFQKLDHMYWLFGSY